MRRLPHRRFRVARCSIAAATEMQKIRTEFLCAHPARFGHKFQFECIYPAMASVLLDQKEIAPEQLPAPHQARAGLVMTASNNRTFIANTSDVPQSMQIVGREPRAECIGNLQARRRFPGLLGAGAASYLRKCEMKSMPRQRRMSRAHNPDSRHRAGLLILRD